MCVPSDPAAAEGDRAEDNQHQRDAELHHQSETGRDREAKDDDRAAHQEDRDAVPDPPSAPMPLARKAIARR